MDKEMLKKINEMAKAHGRQELSLDDMDKVIGGQGPSYMGSIEDIEAYLEYLQTIVDAFGMDVAIGIAIDEFPSKQVRDSLHNGGIPQLRHFLHQLYYKIQNHPGGGSIY